MLLASTALAIGLGILVSDARRQEKAAAAIEDMSGQIVYDWQVRPPGDRSTQPLTPPGPQWLRRLVGPHYFDTIVAVRLYAQRGNNRRRRLAEVIPHLAVLPELRSLTLWGWNLTPEDFQMVSRMRCLEKLTCVETTISEQCAAELVHATALHKLSLERVVISPAALRQFARLPHLESFTLDCKWEFVGTDVTYTDEYKLRDDGAEAIATFPSLRSLSLFQTLLTDDGVAALCQLTSLEELTVSSPLATGAGLRHVLRLTNLNHLSVSSWQLADEDISMLGRLPKLRTLMLLTRPLNDECLAHLAQLDQLEWLSIESEGITDAGLTCLQGMTNLKVLDIKRVVSDRDAPVVKLLRQALPNCEFCLPEPRRRQPRVVWSPNDAALLLFASPPAVFLNIARAGL